MLPSSLLFTTAKTVLPSSLLFTTAKTVLPSSLRFTTATTVLPLSLRFTTVTYRLCSLQSQQQCYHRLCSLQRQQQCYHCLCVCAQVVCNSKWETVALHCAFLNVHCSGYCAVRLLNGWCHVKLLPSRRKFCVHHTTMHRFTVSLYSKPHTRMHECLGVACHLHFWQNDRDVLRRRSIEYRNKSTQKGDPGEENSPAVPAGTRNRDLSIRSPSLYHRAIASPNCLHKWKHIAPFIVVMGYKTSRYLICVCMPLASG